jgi:hypothetical protein
MCPLCVAAKIATAAQVGSVGGIAALRSRPARAAISCWKERWERRATSLRSQR